MAEIHLAGISSDQGQVWVPLWKNGSSTAVGLSTLSGLVTLGYDRHTPELRNFQADQKMISLSHMTADPSIQLFTMATKETQGPRV